MTPQHKIILGDARAMTELANTSVHLIITSPPYWQLKDYGHAGQIGFNDSYEEYINHLNLVWQECHRVLHPGCRLCINIGDQFARAAYYGRYKIIPIRTEIIKFCETIGFDYMGAIIWQKVTTTNTSGGATIMGSFPHPRNGIVKLDYEFILLFKKPGTAPKPAPAQKEGAAMTTEEWNEYFHGHWNFPGEKQNQHLAAFPVELPRRLIRMFSFPGETVLDPFLGSGTTVVAAQALGRNAIGYEINRAFLPVIKNRLGLVEDSLFGAAIAPDVQIIEQPPRRIDFHAEIAKLPYIFRDRVRFDRKVDPRRRHFGSKISGREQEEITYYSVARVEAPHLLELSGGLKIRLLGIKPLPERERAAIEFMQKLVAGQKVFLKFDQPEYDENNRRWAYLYLKNKTFINMHLLKRGLAEVDTTQEFRVKQRMLQVAGSQT
ncbi:MAG: DNA methyltransferase [candidate division KSB1 bacterium]|nr:DNA methyltransferase [candidate division KSB1 bacterium]MDZ7288146.1 DNA methyltransferase [candidate division KSB1 bacterium]MDZ7300341.1 DNA methyltransferase [candidate division KSB1 bacterium]MDZ7306154.1 DNA methyltransferase [candidate division KSB1 bacterium]MDZ7351341.1 DNA methyltransferase [candidate division KSB1 bacterium]